VLFQEGLLLLLDLEIVQGKPEGDAEDIEQAIGDKGVDVVPEDEMIVLFNDPYVPDIALGLDADIGDEHQKDNDDGEVGDIFFSSVQAGHQIERIAVDDEGIAEGGVYGIVKSIRQLVFFQGVDEEHAGEDGPDDPLQPGKGVIFPGPWHTLVM